MRSEKGYSRVLAVLCLGSIAGAVHAEEAWFQTTAVAAFPDITETEPESAPTAPSSGISEGADLKREFGSSRSVRGTARLRDLLPNPYGPAGNDNPNPPPSGKHGFDARVDETYSDARWSNPYVVARNIHNDPRWSNPYVPVQNTQNDERWFNPYVAVQNTKTDERWSNPYAASVSR